MPSTIHRFTPPTCTLEITGQKSPLSRWTDNNVSKKIRFKLRFDDPRQATSREVTIQGDEQELLQLQTVINDYVQTQLHSSFELLKANPVTPVATINEQLPYLNPQGLMHHELFFGSLARDSDRQKIKLGTVQLFDLVTALEAYQAEIAVLSDIEKAKSEQKVIPFWGKIAAVAIATVSIATVISVLQPQPQQNIASDRSAPESTAAIPEFSEITPPDSPDANQKPASPKLGEPLASEKRLPPPPAVETPKPKPDIPDPADYPLSQVARQSGLNDSVKQKKSQPQSTEAEKILGEASPEIISPADKTSQSRQKIELEAEEDIAQTDRDLVAKSSPTQLSQIQEVTAYFENNWQPPENLQQGLEYRLVIAPDGSIQRVVPLGKAARIYLSQTKIPVNGESFISPVSETQPVVIRLLLNPDGRVQTFSE